MGTRASPLAGYGGELLRSGEMLCNACKADVAPLFQMTSVGPHESKMVCPLCSGFLGWGRKEKNIDKRGKNKVTPSDHGIEYCQLCLRHKNKLGKFETLEIHHVIEINKHGEDIKENTWLLCTCCHKLTHHLRTYLNDHFENP